jgi:hypothetical protein
MKIRAAATAYEAWLGQHIRLVRRDLQLKRERMREHFFAFFRGSFYRWAQIFPVICPAATTAPRVLAVGDLHVENYGTWRDAEGRLVWGASDFDEAYWLPYTSDLIRLTTSAYVALAEHHLSVDETSAAEQVLAGYQDALDVEGRPLVLGEHHRALRQMAVFRLHEAEAYWAKLSALPSLRTPVPRGVAKSLARALPKAGLACRIVHRVAGMGSLGRERFLAIADWQGGNVAREAKAMAPSACVWAEGRQSGEMLYQRILDRSVRCADPFVTVKRRWLIRRLAPDCSRIELAMLPTERDEARLLYAMGWETANVHLGSRSARRLRADVRQRPKGWLTDAARAMSDALARDWKEWR